MNTPIADFLEDYEKKGMLRLHMPGHNGEAPHDITEIAGADSLYETDSSRGRYNSKAVGRERQASETEVRAEGCERK